MNTDNYLQRLAGYYHELLKAMRSGATQYTVDFRRKRASKDYIDLATLAEGERLFSRGGRIRLLPPQDYQSDEDEDLLIDAEGSEYSAGASDDDRPNEYDQLLRLYQAHQSNPYERQVLYFYPLIYGNDGQREIFAPLFVAPCRIDYDFKSRALSVELTTDELELNAGLLSSLVDEFQRTFLEETVFPSRPDLPLAPEKIQSFAENLKSLVPHLAVPGDWPDQLESFPMTQSEAGGGATDGGGLRRIAFGPTY